jgi:NAD(P)H-hydrate epimerase
MTIADTLYSAAQVRELERRALEGHGISGSALMARAGAGAFRVLRARFPRAKRIAVVCGSGNNGGDGYVIARLAKSAGLDVFVLALNNGARVPADANAARGEAEAAGVPIQPFSAESFRDADVIVDALFGTGVDRPLRDAHRAVVDTINAERKSVLAVDVPSGLHADTGAAMGAAVCAAVTVTFVGLKAGLFTGAGREHAGEILFDDLDLPASLYNGLNPLARKLSESSVAELIPPRSRDAHKGDSGHVLVVGGAQGMAGAARLCAEAAYRSGSGLTTVATHPNHAAGLNAGRPELLVHGVRAAAALKPLLASCTVIALGPGLGRASWSKALFRAALAAKKPTVVDADALNLLAGTTLKRGDWVLTPHPGEAARLLKTTTSDIQKNRPAAARALVKRYGGVCVLKGSGTLVATANDDSLRLCDRGNPGMASGGMGDVLAGVIAALLAQGLRASDAAELGVWLHASAGDAAAAQEGELGLLAGDLFPYLRSELRRLAS